MILHIRARSCGMFAGRHDGVGLVESCKCMIACTSVDGVELGFFNNNIKNSW